MAKRSAFLSCALTVMLAATLSAGEPSSAESPADSSGWSFAITPYLWLPSVDGSLRYSGSGGGPPTPETDVDNESLIDFLSGAFMIAGEVKKDRWLALSDFIYVDFGNADSKVKAVDFHPSIRGFEPIDATLNTHTETSLTGTAWTMLGGYRALEGPVELDVLGGFRYFGLRASTNWELSAAVPGAGTSLPQTGTASDSTNVWDGLFALHGRVHVAKSRWFLPYYADVGAGGSQLTWQAFGGVGYAFKWLETSLTYRTIYYDERHEGLMNQLSFTGPAAVFTFRF